MQPKLMELKPNRLLLNPNFDGYKLSLTEIPTITKQLETSVYKLMPDINNYTILHAKLYGLHNHLIGENYEDKEYVYFIDKSWKIRTFFIDPSLNQLSDVVLWEIPLNRENKPGDYNASIKLASDKVAVVADGMGVLYVLDRGSRNKDTWKICFSGEVIGPDQNFIISDVVHIQSEKEEIHLLLLNIDDSNCIEQKSSMLYWVTLSKDDTWNQTALRKLTTKGYVYYSCFERSCQAVYIASDTGSKFILDSENEIHEEQEIEIKTKYTWTQSKEEISMKFSLPSNTTKSFISVKTECCKIEVKFGEEILLTGSLYQRIDSDVTYWTFENGILEIVIHKCESGLMWPEIVEGDRSGEYIVDPSIIEEARESLTSLTSSTEDLPPGGTTFNSQQIEECDFECDKSSVFEKISRTSHKVTHKVNLGSHQILITVGLEQNLPPAIGVRYDVDTCIWQPTTENDDFALEHKGTLLALGYIQASKQQKKFFVCPSDLSYSVICESTKHIFIYFHSKSIPLNELRNRITGQRINAIAQQQVVSLPTNDEILGIYASKSVLYVLGDNFITALKL